MSILQSNVDYLTNKVDSKDIDKIPQEDSFKYEQDIVANQGTIDTQIPVKINSPVTCRIYTFRFTRELNCHFAIFPFIQLV